jgi:hypothetical protein
MPRERCNAYRPEEIAVTLSLKFKMNVTPDRPVDE